MHRCSFEIRRFPFAFTLAHMLKILRFWSWWMSIRAARRQPNHAAMRIRASRRQTDPPCLRRVDGNKIYPRDKVNQVHADGEMWSRALWDIRSLVGGTTADRSCGVLLLFAR